VTQVVKRLSKLERLRSQGQWIEVDIDGQKAPYFALPTPELQAEWNAELEKQIRKQLKASGYELLHATRRDHPFHSDILRERIDDLAALLGDSYDPSFEDEAEREEYAKVLREMETNFGGTPCEERIQDHVANALRKNRREWAAAINKFRDYRRDPNWWKGTYLDRVLSPPNSKPLPDTPLPKPVFFKKDAEVVLALHGGMIDFWARLTS
jgi:hypothetical protein